MAISICKWSINGEIYETSATCSKTTVKKI